MLAASVTATSLRSIREKYIAVQVGTEMCNVTDKKWGAKGDGKTNDTDAIQHALNGCKGQILLPSPGKFLVAALAFNQNNTELHIETGATILVSNDISKWPNGSDIISARGLHDIAITGGGTVDGQGFAWWRAMEKPGQHDLFRPHMVGFSHVKNTILSDTLYLNAPNHVLELGSDFTELVRVKVLTPPSPIAHNTDAVDVHGSPFYVHHVNFTTGDDNIAAHANDTIVEDSYFGTGHGMSIGSLCGSYLTNITFRRNTLFNTTAGCRIKSHPNCTGHVWNITYEDLAMDHVTQTIQINQFYFAKPGDPPSSYLFEDIVFRNITSNKAGIASNQAGKGTQKAKPVVNFDCDTAYDGKANCHNFQLIDVRHTDLQSTAGMVCKGITGSAVGVTGIKSCLGK
jgi:polygalacturonase